MGQSLVQLYVHLVFSTKARKPFLRDDAVRDQIHRYLGGAFKNLQSPAIVVGGVGDHVHILCRMGKSANVSDVVRDVKRESSKWIKGQCDLNDFRWQEGYGAFSISPGHVGALIEYINNQAEHHQRESFQDEFRRLCDKYGLRIDERYVWE